MIAAAAGALVGAWALAVATWLFYLAVMLLKRHRDRLHPVARWHANVLLVVGLALDALLNVVVGSLAFLKPPRPGRGEWLLTGRLRNYLRDPRERAWRRAFAGWICSTLLDQFDPSGCHCD